MSEAANPFDRTVCGCAKCVACCRQQPGMLIPGDAERIAQFLGEPVEPYLWASPGALGVFPGGIVRRIGTITPRWDKKTGACVFLTPDGKCRIHPVSPFGCAYVDPHMPEREAQLRSMWCHKQIIASPAYKALRDRLPYATHHKPFQYKAP